MIRFLRKLAWIVGGIAVLASLAAGAASALPPDCSDPGIQNYDNIVDAAVEVRHLRAETYVDCQAQAARLDQLVDSTSGTPTQRVSGTVALSGADRGYINNLHDDLFVIVGAILGSALIGPFLRMILAGR